VDLREIGWGCGVDSAGSGLGPVVGVCEYGDEPSSSGTTELVTYLTVTNKLLLHHNQKKLSLNPHVTHRLKRNKYIVYLCVYIIYSSKKSKSL
jgi:hypothetical protein